MIIVLEGPDLAGKSTVASQLGIYFAAQDREVNVVKMSQPSTEDGFNLFAEYVTAIYKAYTDSFRETKKKIIIFDRLHVGEWVYGPRKRANSLLSWSQIQAIDDLLDSIGAIKVFVNQSDRLLMERYDKRGEDFVTKSELLDIAEHYRHLLDPFSFESMYPHEPGLRRWHIIKRTNDLGTVLS